MKRLLIGSAALLILAGTPTLPAKAGMLSSHAAAKLAPQSEVEKIARKKRHYRRHYRSHRHGHRSHRHYRHAPRGWHRFDRRPLGWRSRGCIIIGPVWYCP